MDEILTALGNANVMLKVKKCKFFSDLVEYPGNIIKTGKLEIDSANTKYLKDEKPPTTEQRYDISCDIVTYTNDS